MACEILYKGKLGDLRRAVKKYLDDKNDTVFLNTFIKGDIPKKTRYTMLITDSTDSVQKAIISFDEALSNVIEALSMKSPKSRNTLEKLQQLVRNKLHIDLDETLSGSISQSEENTEAKTKNELRDINTANLYEHLKDIYGVGAYDIIKSLKEKFDDDTTAVGYWNINTGELVLKSNALLNRNIINLKNKYYKSIVQWLKYLFPNDSSILKLHEGMVIREDTLVKRKVNGETVEETVEVDKFIGSEYFNTMSKFYATIKSLKNFNDLLLQDQIDKIRNTTRDLKEKLYKQLIKVLDNNEKFHKLISNKYNSRKYTEMLENLYQADYFSEYYLEAKRLINKFNLQNLKVGDKTVSEVIEEIESSKLTLLEATNAYTSLTHFDELLKEMHGNSFSITAGTEGIEDGDLSKYSYHQDTAHEIKGWQTSEDIDSEKHIANLTKRVLNQIRVYDVKTGSYQNRRVDSTAYIVAARNLLNDIIYNNITWTKIPETGARREAFNNFIKTVALLHDDPEASFQKILEYLFDTNNGNLDPYYKNMQSRKLLTDYDMDILYSVYLAVYDKDNVNSLISLELKNRQKDNGTVQNLVLEISGFVDRNTTMDYLETSYDFETGEVVVKVKKKFFNSRQLYKTRTAINTKVNSVTADKALSLQDKYNFLTLPAVSGKVYYEVTLPNSGTTLTLTSPNIGGLILTNNGISWQDNTIFMPLDDIDLITFKEKILSGDVLSNDSEILLRDMLLFVDDYLGLGILSNPSFGLSLLQTYKTIYHPVNEKVLGKLFMMPLMLLAMRAAYANSRYAEANGKPLGQYLSSLDSDDGIYKAYTNNKKNKLFSEKYGNVKYTIATFNDLVLDLWTDAYSMLTGEASKATTKDKSGNSIPNNSVNKLGSMLHYYLVEQQDSNVSSLLFVENSNLIRSTFHDLEVTTWNNDIKNIKTFSAGELFFHSIFNKFWGNYINTGNVIIQPTTYSDKTTFLNYEISTKFGNNGDILKSNIYDKEILEQYISTIGTMYKNVFTSTKNKLNLIAEAYNSINNTKLSYKQVLKLMNEGLLIALANSLGIDLELDKDYRIINVNDKKITAANEELEYYAEKVYKDTKSLAQYLSHEKINFVLNLLETNSVFLVIDYGDDISNYLDKKIPLDATSKNTIINTIKAFYKGDAEGRLEFFKNWVDAKTGRLIIAKQGSENITGIGSDFKQDASVILNPLLDRFFLLEGLLSNNLRMSLTGSEINHPDKAFETLYNKAKNKKIKNEQDLQELLGLDKVSKIHLAEAFKVIKDSDYVGDLINYTNPILQDVYEKSLLTISNVSLGTQFKRNVIIPATLQYCQLNVKDGITAKVKCAVIRDKKADVWNYRGDHEKPIDSADGNAKINPFQSILENKSLGSLAVGFVKKPIWHSYDANSGTAFLAKFATDTITNELMRSSSHSNIKLLNLFKKMTNLQWEKGDVNLTQSLVLGELDSTMVDRWFKTTILGNTITLDANGLDIYLTDNRLIYEDRYGSATEIVGFGKTVSEGINLYYTKEKPFLKKTSVTEKSEKVFHIFYDEQTEDGKIVKSKHITFDTYQKARIFIQLHPTAHSINSLYELHTALGGINCIDSNKKPSEFNNEVVVNFMNNVGYRKPGYTKNDVINQTSYELPLKKYHIGYALNNTAVKNGAKNINSSTAWEDDSKLNYFEVNSSGLGMQMNADHDIVDSELTEFSQVVTATSAYGYTHDNCNEIFRGLASAALQASKKALDAVDNFLKETSNREQALSDLYDAIGRIILVNLSIKDKESLLNVIMEAVNNVFYKSKNHNLDSVKIPFSDSNVYSDFIATLASTINKDSIKRKHPGSGCVIVPAYNMVQYFEINGRKLTSSDILKKAREDYKTELKQLLTTVPGYNPDTNAIEGLEEIDYLNNQPTKILEEFVSKYKLENISRYNRPDILDTTEYNNYIISQYLEKMLLEAKTFTDNTWFMPSDVVDIIGENSITTVNLDSLETYYKFKDGLFESEKANGVIIETNYANGYFDISKNKVTYRLLKNNDKYKLSDASLPEIILAAIDCMLIFDKITLSDGIESNNLIAVSDVYVDDNGMLVRDYEKISSSNYGFTYRNNVTVPRNLKPSLIRWQYKLSEDASAVYMNIFDVPIIRNAYTDPNNKPANYREQILNILHNLHSGIGMDRFGKDLIILEGSLENTAAELIMSNLYQDKFGIGEESLNDILELGEKFFEKKYNKLNAPVNTIYDLAFLKDTGKHTLITFGNVNTDGYVSEKIFDNGLLATNEKDEIVLMKGNKELFEVGKWVNNPEGVTYKNGEFILNGKVLDKTKYRLKNQDDPTSILKRIDYVTRYTVYDKITNTSGKVSYKASTLYKIANIEDFKEALGDDTSASNQRASIVSKIYKSDNYKLALVNINKNFTEKKLETIKSATGWIFGNYYISLEVKDLLNTLLSSIETIDLSADKTLLKKSRAKNREIYKNKLQEFLKNEAHKKWISFLDSLNFIASRIPAQTLQSFMSMKLVGWTTNSKNMAYVSHFQTYLLGSDYDIDKAYIMGLSYDDNAIYIKWSNLFDYTSLATLLASKTLPIPKLIEIINNINGVNLDSDINSLLTLLDNDCRLFGTENLRVRALLLFSKILKLAENNNGIINYTGTNLKFDKLLKVLNDHEYYHLPSNIAESAYKNVASANIYAVTHDIRNRDLAYTAISMDILLKAANDSPKGNQSAKLNMLNPLTKYVMQHLNLVGKNVISIAANGEKVWFNAYYYWHKLLKDGKDVSRLKFSQTLNRIAGRASGEKIEPKTVTHLPDLNTRDKTIKNLLISEFGATPESMEYVYVDLLISLLLSAATDNAKELILAKINAGTNFARMYVYAIMTGFNIDDIIAFMTSPVAEFIDLMSAANIFQNESTNNSASSAINLSMGIISPSKFLHGTVLDYVEDPENGKFIKMPVIKSTYVRNILNNLDDSIIELMRKNVKLKEDDNFEGLRQQMLGLIMTAITDRSINIAELSNTDDTEINSYLTYCLDIVEKLRIVNSKYTNTKDFIDDIEEFNKLYLLASEISTISSSWLGLNQGLPTDELSLLKRLMAMSKLVYDRERALGIKVSDIYENEENDSPEEDDDWDEVRSREKSKRKVDYTNNKINLIERLSVNNPTLTNIEARLDAAHDAGIINKFDLYKYLTNSEYAKLVKDYYGLIMGTLNVFDMMEEIPHYQAIKKCLTTLVVANKTLASKSRLIDTLVAKNKTTNLTDQQLKGIIRYVDKLNTYNFVKDLNPIDTEKTIEGFDSYFRNIKTSKIDLSTLLGIATFKHWIENEFLQYLRDNYSNNGLVKHLTITTENDSNLLSTDVDLLNPNVTTVSREGYDEILRGIAEFDKSDSEYSIASLLLLYNLIVNNNKYGSERLTTAFKVCDNPNNILNRYLKAIAKQDYNIDLVIEYDYIDYLINSAPIVSTSAERFHSEKFIKVNDPVRGYILKILGNDNKYREYDMIPPVVGEETVEEKLRRWENFETNCSIQLPHLHNLQHLIRTIDFEGSFDELSEESLKLLKEDIMNLLKLFSLSSKLLIYKDC